MSSDASAGITLVTGTAEFIGFHVAKRLMSMGRRVVGADVVNDYYSVKLKEDRLAVLAENPLFQFERMDLADKATLSQAFRHL